MIRGARKDAKRKLRSVEEKRPPGEQPSGVPKGFYERLSFDEVVWVSALPEQVGEHGFEAHPDLKQAYERRQAELVARQDEILARDPAPVPAPRTKAGGDTTKRRYQLSKGEPFEIRPDLSTYAELEAFVRDHGPGSAANHIECRLMELAEAEKRRREVGV